MRKLFFIFSVLLIVSCKQKEKSISYFKKYDETSEITKQQQHEKERMKFKLIQSKYSDMNEVFKPFEKELATFSDKEYETLKPLVIEKTIPEIQQTIKDEQLTYEKLTLFYLYRIREFESDSTKYLNAIISLNPDVLKEAREKDKSEVKISNESVYGMPILLKDNIGFEKEATTAGAVVLEDNVAKDAFIVDALEENGALILGKVNLSEWAYYFCSGCPLGYSAIGGQTLNPYGRKVFETGGSSAGSGVAATANYAVATVGTETAGSIISPSSQNSVVGLKPTIGLLSRSGIIPISSTLDTPGPMTKTVIDNFIVFKAMLGYDEGDKKSKSFSNEAEEISSETLIGKRAGFFKTLFASDSIYKKTINKIEDSGVTLVEIDPKTERLEGFLTLLNIDMKYDLPSYLKDKKTIEKSVEDIVSYNKKDSLLRAPYGQQLFEGIVKDSTSLEELEKIKIRLKEHGIAFFKAFETENLDFVLSINNYHSAYSATAEYPNLSIPMGYKETGEPIGLTIIGKPMSEFELYNIALNLEKLIKGRKSPKDYK